MLKTIYNRLIRETVIPFLLIILTPNLTILLPYIVIYQNGNWKQTFAKNSILDVVKTAWSMVKWYVQLFSEFQLLTYCGLYIWKERSWMFDYLSYNSLMGYPNVNYITGKTILWSANQKQLSSTILEQWIPLLSTFNGYCFTIDLAFFRTSSILQIYHINWNV